MSVGNGKRLDPDIFQIDGVRMRDGWYTDAYFKANRFVLEALAKEGYKFQGTPDFQFEGIDVNQYDVGNGFAEMQVFTRRKPFSLIAGVDEALAILEKCVGYYDENGSFHSTYDELEIEAVQDGTFVHSNGNPLEVQPVLKLRGKYRDFAILETAYLGVLTIATRIATNVYNLLEAAMGKKVLFFPARFDHWKVQSVHGYAYNIAVEAFKQKYGQDTIKFVSTDAQGEWWGGKGGGTINHAYIAMFLGDVEEAMYQYCRLMPTENARIFLADYHNDCCGDTLKVMKKLFQEYWKLYQEGKKEEAKKYRLDGVRPDTGGNMIDKSIKNPSSEHLGVCPELVWNLRQAIDNFPDSADVRSELPSEAFQVLKQWVKDIEIDGTGGFNIEKILFFKKLGVPLDGVGVGSSLLDNSSKTGTNNDFTADIVRIKIGDTWYHNAKIGRAVCDNPNLQKIQ